MKKIILLLLFILNCQYIIGQFISSHSVATISANATEVRFSLDTNGSSSRAILWYALSPAVATTGTRMNYSGHPSGILPGTLTMQDNNIFTLVGLPLGTTYNYTIQIIPVTATNVIHSVNGAFTTRTASDVTNVTANPVTSTTATINYSINANAAATTPVVSYGTTATTLGTSVNGTVVTGTTPTNGSIAITGLQPGTTYHYRVSGNSVAGTGQSPIQTFTTASTAISALPTAATPQTLCSGATVVNLAATGTDIKWYALATGGSSLANTTVLASGTYYVTQTQTSLAESARLAVMVTISTVNAPTGNATQPFAQGATVANLSATGTGTIAWFASAANATANTNALANTTVLTNNTTYFAVQTVGSCRSAALAVTVSLTPAANAPVISAVSTGAVTTTSATINYSVNANGFSTTPVIRYDTNSAAVSSGLGVTQTCAVVNGTTTTAQTQAIALAVPNATYYYRIEATNSSGVATPSSIFSFVASAPAAVPTITYADVNSTTSSAASISYEINNNGGGASTPIIQFGTNQSNLNLSQTFTAIPSNLNGPQFRTVNLTGLTSGTIYFARVIASNNGGAAIPSSIFTFATSGGGTPATITNVNTGTITSTTAVINYTVNANGSDTSTLIIASNQSTGAILTQNGSSASGTSASNLTLTLTGLQPSTNYIYNIRAVSAGGTVTSNPGVSFTTAAPPSLPVISAVSSGTLTSTTATINYSINAGGASTAPVIKYGTVNNAANLTSTQNCSTVNGSTLTAQSQGLTGLVANTTYFYRVEASNSAGNAVPSNILSFTTAAATTAPSISALTTASVVPSFESARVNFNLNAFGSATTYAVEYSTDIIGTYTSVSGGTTSVNNSTLFSINITNLQSNRQYFVRVRATNASNQVTVSNEVSFTTLNPIAVTNLGSSNITSTTAQINYTLNTNGINAFVEIRYQASTVFNNNNPFTTAVVSNFTLNTATATNLNYVLTGLTPNTLYSYEFGAITNNNGNFEGGQNAAFTTSNPQSPLPTAATPQTFCDGATVASLMATGNNIKWYANASGGSQLATTTLLTPTTYYVTQTQPNLTESARLAVGVNITVVNAPTAQAQSFCNSATVANLTATGTGTLAWFNVATGGTALTNNTALATGTYFVSQTIGSCTSTRTSVAVTINVVNPPQINPTFGFCNATTVASLFGNGTDIKWYDVATGGTALSNTAALMRGTYFASQTINGCESNRTSFFVDIVVVNAPTAQAQSFCNSATVQSLTPNNPAIPNPQAPAFRWYNVATGGTALTASTALASGIYYVSQISSTCESPRTAVVVTVNAVNAPTGSATQIVAAGATIANLNATGSNVVWFASAANAAANINPLPATTLLVNSTTYFAMQTVGTCRSSASLAVTATVSLSASDFDLGLQFNMYPNPATNAVNIEVASELKSVEVYSLQGQKVLSSSSKELNVSDLSSGVYLIRVEDTNGAIATKRLIKK